ncbi:MAG TPA: ferritin family protein [bacterium]|nr:ferritin family protein [bacterium]
MKDDLTLLEVIGLAIRSEEDAAEFYGSISKVINNELVRAKYEALAKEEVGHRQMLVDLYKRMSGEKGAPPRIPGSPATAEGGKPPFEADALEDLLSHAISREVEANDFYRKAAARAIDNNSRRTLEYLADIEHGHELMLRSELEAYLRDRDWYAEKPDVQLVGP